MADKLETREKKRPKRFEGYEMGLIVEEKSRIKRTKRLPVLWEVEDVRKRRGEDVLVKWSGYGEEVNSWVSLVDNPELSCYLADNTGNPDSSAVAQGELPILSDEDRELWVVKSAVFDELQFRRTPENDIGFSRRVRVKVPFSKRVFSSLFQKGTFLLGEERGLDFSGTRNVKFACTAAEIASVFGADSIARQFGDSSTVCEVDPTSKLYVSWGYELRINYDHSSCPRCTYNEEDEDKRPPTCQPEKSTLPPMAYFDISFCKRRRNMLFNKGKVSHGT